MSVPPGRDGWCPERHEEAGGCRSSDFEKGRRPLRLQLWEVSFVPCRKIFILISYIPKGRKIRPGQINGAGIGRIFRR